MHNSGKPLVLFPSQSHLQSLITQTTGGGMAWEDARLAGISYRLLVVFLPPPDAGVSTGWAGKAPSPTLQGVCASRGTQGPRGGVCCWSAVVHGVDLWGCLHLV